MLNLILQITQTSERLHSKYLAQEGKNLRPHFITKDGLSNLEPHALLATISLFPYYEHHGLVN